jgi:hypothetical protein
MTGNERDCHAALAMTGNELDCHALLRCDAVNSLLLQATAAPASFMNGGWRAFPVETGFVKRLSGWLLAEIGLSPPISSN